MTPLSNQVAVVTGAGSGIGKAVSLALARNGATLALVGRRATPLETVISEARAKRTKAQAFPADLENVEEIRDLGPRIEHRFGRLDILVHSAAIVLPGAVAEAAITDLDHHYYTNVRGPYLLTQTVLPLLRESKGQIVFINSSVGITARSNISQYAATKHALRAIADSLRDEVNREGIRVLSIFPGQTATPTQQQLHAYKGLTYNPASLLQPEDVASMIVHALCLPRTAEVTEIRIRPMLKPE